MIPIKNREIVFSLVIILIAGTISSAKLTYSLAETITIYPAEYTQPITNPLRGFRGQKSSRENEWLTVGKYYVGWNEPESNKSDGVKINNIKIVPHVWLDYPGEKPDSKKGTGVGQ